MLCPICKVALSMSSREGIEIDYCPQCRGVWLDRGELDKIIERSVGTGAQRQLDYRQTEFDARPRQAYADVERQRDEYSHKREDYGHKKKKRENFLEDLFDFG